MKVLVSWVVNGAPSYTAMKVPANTDNWELVRRARESLPSICEESVECDLIFHTETPFVDRPDHAVKVYQPTQNEELRLVGTTALSIEDSTPVKTLMEVYAESLKDGPLICFEYGGIYIPGTFPVERYSTVTLICDGKKGEPQIVKTSEVPAYIAGKAYAYAEGDCSLHRVNERSYALNFSDGRYSIWWEVGEIVAQQPEKIPASRCWGCTSTQCAWVKAKEFVGDWTALRLHNGTAQTVIDCPEFEEG